MTGKDSITKNDDDYSITVYGLGGIGLGIAAVWGQSWNENVWSGC